jgi:hypothetical protein
MAAIAMFDNDDGPPPLPPEPSICSNGHDDAADLSDHDRLTAVADISESEHALSIDVASLPDTWSAVGDTRTKHFSPDRKTHIIDADQFVIEECEPIVVSNNPHKLPIDAESMREDDRDIGHDRQSPITLESQNDTNSQAVIMNSMDLNLTELDDDFGDFATFNDDKHITNSLKQVNTISTISTTLPNESDNWASFDQIDASNAIEVENWPAEVSSVNIDRSMNEV